AASVPRSNAPLESTIASIQYAVRRQGIQDLVVCTHLCCDVMRHWIKLLEFEEANQPESRFIRNARDTVDLLYRYTTQGERQVLMTCEHTLFQLENLRSHTFIRERLKSGDLRLHGWVVDDTTARVLAYQPDAHQFVSIEKTVMPKRLID
ncbi:MAG: hypothetical protein KDB00_24055, partial [Planctomycetales bacterium]|nr:hypothetical protein [Planctomycetales bacterium]